jgi:LacI family transcriptional regulator
MGLYAALADIGLRVPADVSVVGFDDIYGHATMPPMTVVSMRLDAVGEKAAALALEMALGSKPLKAYRGHVERVPAELVVRQSTGPRR